MTRARIARRVLDAVVLVAVIAGAAIGGNVLGIRDRLLPIPPRPTPLAHVVGDEKVLASQPWWQPVTTLRGTGPSTAPIAIVAGAVQWRGKWRCDTGRLTVRTRGGAVSRKSLLDAACPGGGVAYSTRTGSLLLDVGASGPWQLEIDQQVDVPQVQPPLAAMTAAGAAAVATGSFYGVDQKGSGKATLYRLADSSFALRLDDFYVTPNVDLEIRLSQAPAPHSDADGSQGVASVARLDATAGSMNFVVPRGVDPTRYRSIVIWCLDLQTAYSAATLTPPP